MENHQDIFQALETYTGREDELRRITRYSLYPVMLYRTNLWNHSRRVGWLVCEINPYAIKVFKDSYDPNQAFSLALVHDDAEIITGDVQAGNKSKMSQKELAQIDLKEKQAVDLLSQRFPKKLGQCNYKDLLTAALEKQSLEAQVVMLADKLDAFGETLHEIFAGNNCFVTNVVNEYGTIPTPYEYYMAYLTNFTHRYPQMLPLFNQKAWFFHIPEQRNFKEICNQSTQHTKKSFKARKGYSHYDEWLKVVMKRCTPQELTELYLPKE